MVRSAINLDSRIVLLVHIMARSERFDEDSTLYYSGIMIKDDMEQPTGIDWSGSSTGIISSDPWVLESSPLDSEISVW